MGCVCCSLSTFASIVLDALERISLCTVCALLTCCLLFTIITVLVMGIGIGYHYCFVSNAVDQMGQAAKQAGAFRSGPERSNDGIMRSVDSGAAKRSFMHKLRRRDADNKNATQSSNPLANNIKLESGAPQVRAINTLDNAKKSFLAHHIARRVVNEPLNSHFNNTFKTVLENQNITFVNKTNNTSRS